MNIESRLPSIRIGSTVCLGKFPKASVRVVTTSAAAGKSVAPNRIWSRVVWLISVK